MALLSAKVRCDLYEAGEVVRGLNDFDQHID